MSNECSEFLARTTTSPPPPPGLSEPLSSKLGGKSFHRSRATVVSIVLYLSVFVFCFTPDLIEILFFASLRSIGGKHGGQTPGRD